MTRFNYLEDIRIDPIPLSDGSIAFEQSRDEDYAESQESREIRVGIRATPWLRVLALGDGSVLKEYGDMGAGARFFESADHATDVYAWSVDHYYNEKTHEEGARQKSSPTTYGFRSKMKPKEGSLSWNILAEDDRPISWHRPTRGDYSYERRKIDGQFQYSLDAVSSLICGIKSDHKKEGWQTLDEQSELALERKLTQLEIGTAFDKGPSQLEIKFLYLERNSNWIKRGSESYLNLWSSDVPPDFSRRDEWGAVVRSTSEINAGTLFTHGMVFNAVDMRESTQDWRKFEAKYLTALNWNFAPNAGFGLNATWDIDQLAQDFPYKNAAFRPWGGGNIQGQMTF